VFVVPFAIMVALGVEYLSSRGAKVMKIKSGLVTTLVCLLFLAPNLYLLASLHPYQNTYFNSLIGGLKGAQDKEFPFSCDYYFNSIRKAGEWLNKNGERNAHCFAYSAEKLIFYYISRSDITPLHKETFLQEIPPNTYVVIVPRKHWPGMVYKSMDEILSRVAPLKIVYQIKRQGGEIVTVYYKS
jgi:hypothetical protein